MGHMIRPQIIIMDTMKFVAVVVVALLQYSGIAPPAYQTTRRPTGYTRVYLTDLRPGCLTLQHLNSTGPSPPFIPPTHTQAKAFPRHPCHRFFPKERKTNNDLYQIHFSATFSKACIKISTVLYCITCISQLTYRDRYPIPYLSVCLSVRPFADQPTHPSVLFCPLQLNALPLLHRCLFGVSCNKQTDNPNEKNTKC